MPGKINVLPSSTFNVLCTGFELGGLYRHLSGCIYFFRKGLLGFCINYSPRHLQTCRTGSHIIKIVPAKILRKWYKKSETPSIIPLRGRKHIMQQFLKIRKINHHPLRQFVQYYKLIPHCNYHTSLNSSQWCVLQSCDHFPDCCPA